MRNNDNNNFISKSTYPFNASMNSNHPGSLIRVGSKIISPLHYDDSKNEYAKY